MAYTLSAMYVSERGDMAACVGGGETRTGAHVGRAVERGKDRRVTRGVVEERRLAAAGQADKDDDHSRLDAALIAPSKPVEQVLTNL